MRGVAISLHVAGPKGSEVDFRDRKYQHGLVQNNEHCTLERKRSTRKGSFASFQHSGRAHLISISQYANELYSMYIVYGIYCSGNIYRVV